MRSSGDGASLHALARRARWLAERSAYQRPIAAPPAVARLRAGALDDRHWARLVDAAAVLSQAPLHIDDSPGLSVGQLAAKARRAKQAGGLDLIVVDYLQLLAPGRRADSRQQEVADISRGLKLVARQLDVVVVAVSQLSRQPELRADKRPQLADLRDSGALEQDADLVLFLYRDELYQPDTPRRGIAQLHLAKQRNGPTGTINLAFIDHLAAFANLAHHHTP